MKNLKNKKGFTLVELVIVIAVIAILAAVLIPTFSNVIEKANESAAQQEAAAIWKEVYALDMSDGTQDAKENGAEINVGKTFTYTYENSVISFSYTTAKGYIASYNGSTWSVRK